MGEGAPQQPCWVTVTVLQPPDGQPASFYSVLYNLPEQLHKVPWTTELSFPSSSDHCQEENKAHLSTDCGYVVLSVLLHDKTVTRSVQLDKLKMSFAIQAYYCQLCPEIQSLPHISRSNWHLPALKISKNV